MRCTKCNRTKTGRHYSYRKTICNLCYKKSPAYRKTRDRYLRATYGISIELYEAMLTYSGGKCWICGGKSGGKNLAVDHNHRNGRVRGLLCKRCNTTIARWKDDAETMQRAANYIRGDGQIVEEIIEWLT